MKIVISDYPDVLGRNIDYEQTILKKYLPQAEIVIYPYKNKSAFFEIMKDANALLTAFLPIDVDVMEHAENLQCVSFNSTGYDFIDYEEACKRKIAIIPIAEYCTQEVADHTMALVLSLARGIKHYIRDVDVDQRWQYYSVPPLHRLSGATLAIFGLGKIGQAVARRAQAFGLKVIAFDPFVKKSVAEDLNVELKDTESIWNEADIITNHMRQTTENHHFFCWQVFEKMKRNPIFINVARGGSVCEEDLAWALDKKYIRAAGLDVLEKEAPDLLKCDLTNRENVILTPHAAFYSEESLSDLQRISCENAAHYLRKEYASVFKIVNWEEIYEAVLKNGEVDYK